MQIAPFCCFGGNLVQTGIARDAEHDEFRDWLPADQWAGLHTHVGYRTTDADGVTMLPFAAPVRTDHRTTLRAKVVLGEYALFNLGNANAK